jgi:DNA-binding helix-hairpin-helix protein with protein kinase domain
LVVLAWWIALECERRTEQAERKQVYEEEQQERRRLAEAQLEAWRQKRDRALVVANRQYQAAVQSWEQLVAPIRHEAERRRTASQAAIDAVQGVASPWTTRANQLCAEFDRKKGELAGLREQLVALTGQLATERQHLIARGYDIQRVEFLEQQFIEDANIPDIGRTRKATLASFGIETAYDVKEDEILAIPGFGEKLTARLTTWRAEIESKFRFNPTLGVSAHEQRALELKFFQFRQPIEAKLLAGERDLAGIVHGSRAEFQGVQQRLHPLLEVLDQATADLTVIPSGI